mmetsp:Transcript_46442/g.89594  ORF Transcript_46442/g.89594 Transcript_46442/m.89594 type:complete len:518 (-) Transcript_46442:51-1604(-)
MTRSRSRARRRGGFGGGGRVRRKRVQRRGSARSPSTPLRDGVARSSASLSPSPGATGPGLDRCAGRRRLRRRRRRRRLSGPAPASDDSQNSEGSNCGMAFSGSVANRNFFEALPEEVPGRKAESVQQFQRDPNNKVEVEKTSGRSTSGKVALAGRRNMLPEEVPASRPPPRDRQRRRRTKERRRHREQQRDSRRDWRGAESRRRSPKMAAGGGSGAWVCSTCGGDHRSKDCPHSGGLLSVGMQLGMQMGMQAAGMHGLPLGMGVMGPAGMMAPMMPLPGMPGMPPIGLGALPGTEQGNKPDSFSGSSGSASSGEEDDDDGACGSAAAGSEAVADSGANVGQRLHAWPDDAGGDDAADVVSREPKASASPTAQEPFDHQSHRHGDGKRRRKRHRCGTCHEQDEEGRISHSQPRRREFRRRHAAMMHLDNGCCKAPEASSPGRNGRGSGASDCCDGRELRRRRHRRVPKESVQRPERRRRQRSSSCHGDDANRARAAAAARRATSPGATARSKIRLSDL